MKRQFAKMFDTRVGQIVVIAKDGDDACPELRFFFRPGVLADLMEDREQSNATTTH